MAVSDHLSAQGQRSVTEDGGVKGMSDVASEYQALKAGAGWGPRPITPLRVTGADRLDFLHGQLANEVKGLPVGEMNVSLMLNHKGQALALMRVYRRPDDVYVAVEGGAGAQVKEQLEAHIIFDQVELTDLSETLTALTVQGEKAAEVIRQLFDGHSDGDILEGTFVQLPFAGAEVLVSPMRRSLPGGFDLHVLSKDAPALREALAAAGAVQVGAEVLETARVEAGIPDAAHEGGAGVLPQEAGLEYALSYHKGCYLGQEIMARIEARGKVRRRLVGLRLERLPEAGAVPKLDGKVMGRLGTVMEHPELGVIALASVRNEAGVGERLELGEVGATLCSLPFA